MNDFDADSSAAHRLSDWLFEVPQRLDVAIEVVDKDLVSILPVPATAAGMMLRHALTADPAFRETITAVIHSGDSRPATIDGTQAVCVGLATANALIVARHATEGMDPDAHLRDLVAIGSWLREPVEAELTRPAGALDVEGYRVASLRRILDEAAVRGSARSVLGAFVEALGVWHDVRAVAYAATVDGRFVRYASPRDGGGEESAPEFDARAVRMDAPVERLAADTAERLSLATGGDDVLLGRVRTAEGLEWRLVFRGTIDERDRARLTLYADFLRDVLDKTLATEYRRTEEAGFTRPPLQPGEPLESVAREVAAHLAASINAPRSALAMALASGRQVFAVGSTDLLYGGAESMPNRLAVTSCDAAAMLTFAAARDELFLALDRQTAHIAVAAAQRWLAAHLDVSRDLERRDGARRVDVLFEDHARAVVKSGRHVSVAVVSLGAEVLRPGALQESLGTLRDHLRSDDIAGVVSPTEIAVLLPAVQPPDAEILAARLQRLLTRFDARVDSAADRPSVAVATWAPNQRTPESIVATARAALQPAR